MNAFYIELVRWDDAHTKGKVETCIVTASHLCRVLDYLKPEFEDSRVAVEVIKDMGKILASLP